MKKVLITGGAGYVGSHTCKYLKSQGYEPIVFDNFDYGHRYATKWGEVIEGDLRDLNAINNAIKDVNPTGVIHCSAYTYVGESVGDPYKYYLNNTYGSLNLFKAMIENNVKYLVFSSTCATYGNVEKMPITESTLQNPISPYGESKLMVEKILQDFNKAYGLNYVNVRYFNVAGADEMGEIGEDHNPETHLIPLILEVALGKREKILIFGDDYNTKDGTCLRDYIHVNDLANAHLKAFEYLQEGTLSDSFNLGTGNPISVKEIIKAVEDISGKKIKKEIVARREGDPAILTADITKAKDILKWQPKHIDIKEIVASAYQWELNKEKVKSSFKK